MVTIDTNIAFYAMAPVGPKSTVAKEVVKSIDFVSVQVLNEFANAARRKLRRTWEEIDRDVEVIQLTVQNVQSIGPAANREALRIVARYELQFYDALMIAVALENGATTLFSEDMQHGLVIDDSLTITNPFLPTETQ